MHVGAFVEGAVILRGSVFFSVFLLRIRDIEKNDGAKERSGELI